MINSKELQTKLSVQYQMQRNCIQFSANTRAGKLRSGAGLGTYHIVNVSLDILEPLIT